MPEVVGLFNFNEAGLKPFESNTRSHNIKNLEAIDQSVEENGFMRSITVAEDNTIIAGHGTAEIAEKRGAKLFFVDVDDDNTLVVVRKKGLIDEKAKARANLWDNRASDLSRNDKDAIKRLATKNPSQRILKGIFSEKDEKRILSERANAQSLSEGGSAAVQIEKKQIQQESNIRMVQIMLTTDIHPEFMRKAYAIGTTLGLRNINDIMVAVVDKGYSEWVSQKENENNSVAASA